MTATPLRDAVIAKIRRDEVIADMVLRTVADHIEASILTTTDARKRTILTGLADRIARGAL